MSTGASSSTTFPIASTFNNPAPGNTNQINNQPISSTPTVSNVQLTSANPTTPLSTNAGAPPKAPSITSTMTFAPITVTSSNPAPGNTPDKPISSTPAVSNVHNQNGNVGSITYSNPLTGNTNQTPNKPISSTPAPNALLASPNLNTLLPTNTEASPKSSSTTFAITTTTATMSAPVTVTYSNPAPGNTNKINNPPISSTPI
ncbi:8017_t:CDS:2, partial [Ambispora gerdemannii]